METKKSEYRKWLNSLPQDVANVLKQYNEKVIVDVLSETPISEFPEAIDMMLPPKMRREIAQCGHSLCNR